MKHQQWLEKLEVLEARRNKIEVQLKMAEIAIDQWHTEVICDEKREGFEYLAPILKGQGWTQSGLHFLRGYNVVQFDDLKGRWEVWVDGDRPSWFWSDVEDYRDIPTVIAEMDTAIFTGEVYRF